MPFRSIKVKLWLVMLALVVLVLAAATLIQVYLFERTYYELQALSMVEAAEKLANSIQEGQPSSINDQVSALSGVMGASVLVVDPQGKILSWFGTGRGMGMGMGRGRMLGGVPFKNEDIKNVMSGNKLVYRENNEFFGADVMVVGVPALGENGSVEFAVLIHSPVAPIVANMRAFNRPSVYSMLFGIVVATVLTLLLSRSLTGPLLKMNQAALAMARGNYNLKVPVRSRDEIGALADSLNKLSAEIDHKIKLLNKVDDTRREFIASVSHEIRTPLTIMQGYTEALLDGVAQDSEQSRKYLLYIHDELKRLRRLADQLLDLRLVETGNVPLHIANFDLVQSIIDVRNKFNDFAQQRDSNILLNTPGSLDITGDQDRIKQVVINLLQNALRFSQPGSTVGINIINSELDVEVEVKDSGPGIPPGEQELIWDRFYKSDPARSRDNSGAGIGLAIVRGIVELHGGTVGIRENQGVGTAIWFKIPKIYSKQSS